MMNNRLFIAAFVAALVTFGSALPSLAGPPTGNKQQPQTKKSAKIAAVSYTCPDCHDTFTAAQAKKDGMKCACCQTKLVVAKAKPAKKNGKG